LPGTVAIVCDKVPDWALAALVAANSADQTPLLALPPEMKSVPKPGLTVQNGLEVAVVP